MVITLDIRMIMSTQLAITAIDPIGVVVITLDMAGVMAIGVVIAGFIATHVHGMAMFADGNLRT